MMRKPTQPRPSRGDGGFTLVELIMVILILGVITVPLANVVIGYLRNTDETTARLLESHDVQIASAYWAQDVASIGMRIGPGESGFELTPYALKPSVAVGTDSSLSGLTPCPATGTPIVRLAWDEFRWDEFSGSEVKTIVQVVYVLNPQTELHRIRCDGSGSSDVTLTHDLSTPAAVACSTTCSAAPAIPTTVTLTLTLKNPGNPGAAYAVTLTGQRRQS